MKLKKYNEKRDFDKTNEPKGKTKKTSSKRFVVQYHQARAKHYDFRLEYKGVLLSWAIPKGLSNNPKDKRLAVMVEDHPIDYINFEGIIPKGNYGAGTVEIFDKGKYLPIDDFESGLKKGHLKFVLSGKKLQGGWSLIRIDEKNWLIVKLEDEFIKKEKPKKTSLPFKSASVELATLTDKIPKGKEWIFEIKYDGYRIVTYVENGRVKMLSRNGIEYTSKFQNIANLLKEIDNSSFVVDGEVVAFDENGRSDFGLLQEKIKKGKKDFYYVIFDLLALNGEDLRNLTLKERKSKLERLLYKTKNNLIYSTHVSKGEESFKFAKNNNLEGIVAKNLNSVYEGKRSENWLKIKCYLRQEFVIAGYTTSSKNELISALILGYYSNSKFIYIGKVGTGLSDEKKKDLHKKFQKIINSTCSFNEKWTEENTIWLKPKYVAEIQYTELTKENLLRQPSFIGLREDKNPKDVTLESKK